jgi:hypothetical protein
LIKINALGVEGHARELHYPRDDQLRSGKSASACPGWRTSAREPDRETNPGGLAERPKLRTRTSTGEPAFESGSAYIEG